MSGPGPACWVAAILAALAVWWATPGNSLARLRPVRETRAHPRSRIRAWLRAHVTSRAGAAHDRALAEGVPAVCDLLAVCVESGRPPRSALLVVAEASPEPTRSALLGVWNQIDLGVREELAWASLGELPGYQQVGRDLARSVSTGVALASRLRAHARAARVEVEEASRVRARTVAVSGVIPLMVCYLPAFMLVGIVPIFGGLVSRFFG